MSYQVGERFRPVLEAARRALEAALTHVEGAAVADNNFALSVHYRNVTGRLLRRRGDGDGEEEELVDVQDVGCAAVIERVRARVEEQVAKYGDTLDVSGL